ncbi:DUF262 domain-containing HNH endonuclease family protein [Streptomyces sp. NPDC046994]|uniref:DUF262 domain-containing protein n=1 Tax=Streptomyces sp. NPDC046994 TaxID=3155735 RepID=UPI0034530EAC
MIYEPAKRTIGQLLGDAAKKTSVPDYQRDYSWNDTHVDYFWQDISTFTRNQNEATLASAEYFIGSMVRVELDAGYELLDGQQRLATTVILLSAIRDNLRPLNSRAADRTQDRWIAEEADRTGVKRYSLQLSTYDRDYFRRRIQDESKDFPEPNTKSQRLIDAARRKFDSELRAELDKKVDQGERERWLLLLRDVILDHVSTVTVTCSSEQDAASIFETLNDRGLGLSTVDLLRNFVLRRAGDPEREEIVHLWGDILEQSKYVDVDEFLRHYWTSRHGDIKSQRLYRVIRQHLEAVNGSSLDFMRDLAASHASYVRLLRPDFEDSRVNDALHDVADLKAKMLYPLLLSGLSRAESEFAALLHGATTYYVREGIVAKQNGSRMEKLVFAAAERLYRKGEVTRALAQLHGGSVTESVFNAAVQDLKSLDTASARYLLREIEISLRNGEETDVARQPRIHVEHIYPQKPKTDERWNNHSEYVGKLGNLTILSRRINTSIKNSNFSIKRVELAKSELFITQRVAQETEWNPERINLRQAELGKEIEKIWAWLQSISGVTGVKKIPIFQPMMGKFERIQTNTAHSITLP